MAPCVLLLLLALVSCTYAMGHFYGGLMNFYFKGKDEQNNFLVDLLFRESATAGSCALENTWTCDSGDCGETTFTSVVETFSGNGICQTLGILSVQLPTNRAFQMKNSDCCWTPHVPPGSEWNMLTRVDLGIRSDTLVPNKPPIFTVLPEYRVFRRCYFMIALLQHDRDGDTVRCRLATDDCRVCSPPPEFTLLEDSCIIDYPLIAEIGKYVFEIVVEDFPQQEITLTYSDGSSRVVGPSDAISKQPLSLIIEVPGDVACDPIPEFDSPTPTNGEVLEARVGEPLEIAIAAKAEGENVAGVVASGPLGMTLSTEESSGITTITVIPNERDADEHVPLCFAAENDDGGHRFHSDMRCVIVAVGPKSEPSDEEAGGDETPDDANQGGESEDGTTVVCLPTSMTITAELSVFTGFNGGTLSLISPSCTATITDTHVTATTDLNACGTKFEEDNDNVVFKNSISLVHDEGDVITRADDVEIQFSCIYPKREIVSSLFKALRLSPVFEEEGFGKFSFQFEFFNGDTFETKVDTGTKPFEVNLRQMIFMQIKTTAAQNAVLFVESCRATPEDDPDHETFYSIIENGCIKDETVKEFESQSHVYRIGMKVFRFIGESDEVYIHCSVILCIAGSAGTRCTQGCIESGERRKRSVAGETDRHNVVQGPLRLKRSSDEKGSPRVAINLNAPALTLLVAVALVCAVVAYKIKKSSTGYERLPESDI